MTAELVNSRSRRQMLGAALGGLGALVATVAHRPSRTSADTGGNFILGNDNTADTVTRLTTDAGVVGGTGLEVVTDTETQVAISAQGGSTGVASTGTATGVQGTSETDVMSIGVRGTSVDGIGVVGDADGAGMFGAGFFGVIGQGGIGVTGDTDGGCGVQGWSGADFPPLPTAQTGVWAGASGARTALQVDGRAKFTRSGRTTIGAGDNKKTISVPGGVFSNSFAFAMLNTNRAGVYVRAVVPNATTDKITIYLNTAVSGATQCAWIVLS